MHFLPFTLSIVPILLYWFHWMLSETQYTGRIGKPLQNNHQLRICSALYRFQPFVWSIFSRHFYGYMCNPAILCRFMPALRTNRYCSHISQVKLLRLFVPFLIPTAAARNKQNLTAVLLSSVNIYEIYFPILFNLWDFLLPQKCSYDKSKLHFYHTYIIELFSICIKYLILICHLWQKWIL